jgi:hypothetical protein
MAFGAAFRWLWPGRTGLQRYRTQHWDTRREATVNVGSGYGVSVDDGDPVEEVKNLVPSGAVLAQASAGDQPTVDTATVPGALLIETINDDYMSAAVSGQILTLAIAFRDDGASTERSLVARDTSEATDKPAFELSIIEE